METGNGKRTEIRERFKGSGLGMLLLLMMLALIADIIWGKSTFWYGICAGFMIAGISMQACYRFIEVKSETWG